MHRALAFVERHGRGLWGLALLSAVIMPLALHVAALHRGHWAPGPAGPFWAQFAGWATVAWSVLGAVALAGWIGGARPDTPGASRWWRLGLGLRIAGLGWLVWCAAAIPGLVWAARLGVPAVGDAALPQMGVLALAAALAGAVGSWRGFAGVLAGGLGGAALVWVAA